MRDPRQPHSITGISTDMGDRSAGPLRCPRYDSEVDSAVERILAGGQWYGAKGRSSAAWQLRRGDGFGGPLTATRVSDGLTLALTDLRGYLDEPFESDDDAGGVVEWIEDLLAELDAADSIPTEAVEGIDLSDIRLMAEALIPPPPPPGTEVKWKMLRDPRQ
jgi:hypothetical protein